MNVHVCMYCLMNTDPYNHHLSPFLAQAPAPTVESPLALPDSAVLNGSGEGSGPDRKRKGSRTTLTASQLQKLMQVYEYEARPTKETKLALSKATGLE